MHKPTWCKIPDHEYMVHALLMHDICKVCELKQKCTDNVSRFYTSRSMEILLFNRTDFFIAIKGIKTPLPKTPIYCNHCNKTSANAVAFGAKSDDSHLYTITTYKAGDRKYYNFFLIQCNECGHRWAMNIDSFNHKMKTNWALKTR